MNPSVSFERRQNLSAPSQWLVMRRLGWKEIRQLVPLMGMLSLIAISFHFLAFMIRQAESSSSMVVFAFFGLPTLFAAGVGAMLVGQERETKTLHWMASLPIRGTLQARVKLIVGAVGLITMWGLSVVLITISAFFQQGGFINLDQKATELPFYLVHSIFLLLAGFACAWYFHNTLIGLLGLVAATILTTLVDAWLSDGFWKGSNMSRFIAQLGFCALAYGAYRIAAYRAYRPLKAPRSKSQAIETKSYFDHSTGFANVLTPRYALLWQFYKQNSRILLAMTGLCAFGLILLAYSSITEYGIRDGNDINPIVLGCFFVACCGLGLIAFQGDSLHQRVRFLADRGISPRLFWFSRHTIPFSILMTITIVLATIGILSLLGRHVTNQDRFGIQIALLAAAAYAWIAYAVSQWTSHVVRSAVVSTIVCPIVAAGPLAFGIFAVTECEAPILLLLASCVIPFIATYRTTQQWMELRVTKVFWIEHGLWLAVAIVVPLLPFAYSYLTYPGITSGQQAKLVSDANVFRRLLPYQTFRIPPIENPTDAAMGSLSGMMGGSDGGMADMGMEDQVADGSDFFPDVTAADPKPKSAWDPPIRFGSYINSDFNLLPIVERMAKLLDHIESHLAGLPPETSIEESMETLQLHSDTTLLGMKLQGRTKTQSAENKEKRKDNENDTDHYRRAMKSMLTICKGIRNTPNLAAQQRADFFDSWLFNELKQNDAKETLGSDLWQEIYEYLRDKNARQDIRYKAIVLDWSKSKSSTAQIGQLGRFATKNQYTGIRWKAGRDVDRTAWLLTEFLFAPNEATRKLFRKELGMKFKNPDFDTAQTLESYKSSSGSWFGEWEKQIDALEMKSEVTQ